MSFDTLAPHYRWLETALAGGVLQRARLAHLTVLDRASHVLLVGEGPGRFLRALQRYRSDVRITVVEASAGMLRRARRTSSGRRTEFIHADVRTWRAPARAFDAVVTSCVLDCFNPTSLENVIARLARAATPNADWLVTDFQLPASGWRRQRARVIHRLMYQSFRLATRLEARELTPPDPFLRHSGFERRDRRTFNAGLIHADHWQRSSNSGILR